MENKKKTRKVLFVARDDGGCGFFRCKQPAEFLKRSGIIDAEYVLRTPTFEQLMSADLVVMQDTGSTDSSTLAKFMRDNKIPYITEFDDFVFHISPHNLGGYPAWNPSTLFLHRSLEVARRGVGMTVSTPFLAREMFPYNNNIYVLPNYLDKDKWDQPRVKRQDDKIRIGWCGGNAHGDDLFMVAKVIDKIVKEYKGKVIFETIGMTRKELAGVFPMKIFNETCPSCEYEGEVHHFPGESLEDYPMVLASKGWDIAIAPVIDNSFGNAKSDLKVKEYAAAGIPMVASKVSPYEGAVDNGAQIILAITFDEWYGAIKELIENESKRSDISRHNREWVEKHYIQNNVENIAQIYEQIISAVEPILGTSEDRKKAHNLL